MHKPFNQVDLLWSVIQRHPAVFSSTILSKWTKYDGILNLKPFLAKSSKHKLSAVMHNCYTLTTQVKKWLNNIGVLEWNQNIATTAINSHNEQAIEVIVQGLYTAQLLKWYIRNADILGFVLYHLSISMV